MKNNKKVIVVILVIIVLLSLVGYYFYERSFGYFVPISLEKILPAGNTLVKLYKTGDFYTIVDNVNNIYKVDIKPNLKINLISKSSLKDSKVFVTDNLLDTTKIDKNTNNLIIYKNSKDKMNSIQLHNGNILFYRVDKDDKITLYVYEPLSNQIINRYQSANNTKSYSFGAYINTIDEDSALITTQDKKTRITITELYNSKNNTLIPIKTDGSDNLFPFEMANVQLSENESLFIKYVKEKKLGKIVSYIYDSKKNLFYQTGNLPLDKNLDILYKIKLVPLKMGHFLLIEEGHNKNKLIWEDIISKYEFKNNKFERISTFGTGELGTKYFFTNYTITQANILPLNEDELLVTGGMAGVLIAYGPVSRAYLINLKKQKVRRIGNMKKRRSNQSSILIDEKSAIIYRGDYILNIKTDVEGFKRGRVW